MPTHMRRTLPRLIIGACTVGIMCTAQTPENGLAEDPRPDRVQAAHVTVTFPTVATSELSIALDSEGAVSNAVLTRFFPDHEAASLRGVRLRISGKKDLEEIRMGLVNAVRPVFVSHLGAEAGAVHIAKLALAVDDKELAFWVFSFGFSLTPQAVQGKLFFSAGLADVINRLFVSNEWPSLSPDTMLGLCPPSGQTATDASHEVLEGRGTRGPGSPL